MNAHRPRCLAPRAHTAKRRSPRERLFPRSHRATSLEHPPRLTDQLITMTTVPGHADDVINTHAKTSTTSSAHRGVRSHHKVQGLPQKQGQNRTPPSAARPRYQYRSRKGITHYVTPNHCQFRCAEACEEMSIKYEGRTLFNTITRHRPRPHGQAPGTLLRKPLRHQVPFSGAPHSAASPS